MLEGRLRRKELLEHNTFAWESVCERERGREKG